MHVIKLLKIIKNYPRLISEFILDANRYLFQSMYIEYSGDKEKHLARITMLYHNLEKGLSLEKPKSGFGKDKALKLIDLIEKYIYDYGASEQLNVALSVLLEYVQFSKFQDLTNKINELLVLNNFDSHYNNIGGTKEITKEYIINSTNSVSSDFFFSRSSVRQFKKGAIEKNIINDAVLIAQKSPVVCNRQSGKVYTIVNNKLIKQILDYHGGAKGFEEGVETLFCITVDMKNFIGIGERYQFLIDGGLFAMSFIYGLHMHAVGTCCLNWSKTNEQDRYISELLNIPINEKVIMFVAAGLLKDNYKVAYSFRKPIGQIHKIIE